MIAVAVAAAIAITGWFVAGQPMGGLQTGRFGPQQGTAWIDALMPSERISAIQAMMDRRAAAVKTRDRASFLADIDSADPDFVRKQSIVYDNLVRLPLVDLSFRVEPRIGYPRAIPIQVKSRFRSVVYAPGVTIQYRVAGIDSAPVAAPWVPILGYAKTGWVIVSQATEPRLPYGVNGQAWDAGPIVVVRSARVVVVLSEEDSGRGPFLLKLAESGLDRVRAVRSGGWDGKVVVVAVQDQKIFDGYFATAPDRIANVAAIAVPYYEQVPDWGKEPKFTTTRVVFNPRQLSAEPEEMAHDLVHEFTHVAMGSVTGRKTPRWLVEGFAEYTAYLSEDLTTSGLRRMLRDVTVGDTLPADEPFYSNAKNYITSWLACRMIAERYGRGRLVSLYESFQSQGDPEINIRAVLGMSQIELTTQWRDYVQRKRQ